MFLVITEELERLDNLVFTNISSAWSSNTIATRSSQWKRFLKFCIEYGLTPMPASSKTVARFLSDLALTSKYSTVVNYLSSITTMHRFYSYDTDFRESYYLSMTVKGIKVNLGSEVHQMVALTPKQLLEMYVYVSLGNQFEVACWSAIIFSFRTLLRKSHFLPDSTKDNPHLIDRADVTFHRDHMLIKVSTSKTDRSGGKPFKIMVYRTDQRPLCAFSWLQAHFASTPEPSSGLFVKQIKNSYVPLSYKDVLQFLQKLVEYIGLSPHDAGLHSLRRSGASYLNTIGVPLPDIKLIGNWRSNAVLEYIKCSDERMASIQKSFACSLTQV